MKKRWGWWNNCLVGITWDRWRALLAENTIDPAYRHRAVFLTLSSLRNTAWRRREERLYGEAIAKTTVEAPLFVLGHWRTGTTHMHNLLACDSEQFAWPNSIQATFPSTFLYAEPMIRRQFEAMVPSTRPMDNVALTPDTPQEDEFALAPTSLKSPHLGMSNFPRRAEYYDRYLTFRNVPAREQEEWKATFLWYLRKLTLKHGRRLLLKSPAHTARIRMLLELFPDAAFVHIHREPYSVFRSTQHLLRQLWPLHALQSPPHDVDEAILRRGGRIYDALFEERALIPEGRFQEIAYQDLVRDPIGQVRATYERLELEEFEAVRPRLDLYVASLSGYRRNEHAELPAEARQRVVKAWGRIFEEWRYRV